MEERRSVTRWQINAGAGLTFDNGLNPVACTVKDISTLGMCVALDKEVFPEAFSNISLALDDKCVFNTPAKLAWQEKRDNRYLYGVSFSYVEEPMKDQIFQYVNDNYPGELVKQWWKGE